MDSFCRKYFVFPASYFCTNLIILLLSLQELEVSLQSASGKLYALKCDITKEEDIKEAFQWVKNNLGGVDILVNNAGGGRKNTLCGNSDITCVSSHLGVPPVISTSKRQLKQHEVGWMINTIRLYFKDIRIFYFVPFVVKFG